MFVDASGESNFSRMAFIFIFSLHRWRTFFGNGFCSLCWRSRERERGRKERLSKSETRLPSAATSSRRHRRCYCSSSSLTSGNLIKFWTFDKELFRRSSSQYAKVTLRYTYSLGNSWCALLIRLMRCRQGKFTSHIMEWTSVLRKRSHQW